jgi:signal transduction histidine kinase
LCQNAQGLAASRGLALRAEGPAALQVEGDAVKVQRVAQNLLMNALKYTRQGSVTVTWGESDAGRDVPRWFLCVEDTGPGVDLAARPPILRALKVVTDSVAEAESQPHAPAAPGADTLTPAQQPAGTPGEGLGLSIVKQLCELLDATLELDSRPGNGTTVRVLLPARYEQR